ncbi:MAG: haloacid dehalogenase [marine bacterium B5-7]|nr:MAG: haloacid dehalogenase [marine bacterium B5-7]
MRLGGVLFDKDGTLIDFNATWLPAYHAAAKKIAELANDPDIALTLMHQGGWNESNQSWQTDAVLAAAGNDEILDLWYAIAPVMDRVDFDNLVLNLFHDHAGASPVPFDGINSLFNYLSSQGYLLGIATNDAERTARATAELLDINQHTTFIAGADSGFGAKPSTGMLDAFCRHGMINPEDVVVIGDSPHDLAMGRVGGAGLVVGVLSGAHGIEELEPLADCIISDATRLRDFL